MKEKIKKLFGRYAAAYIAVLLVLALVIPGIIVIAEFTKSDRTKRVIGTYGDIGSMFSSNYLANNMAVDTSSLASNTTVGTRRYVYVGSAESEGVAQVTVCNYPQGNSSLRYDSDITYTLYAMLVKIDGSLQNTATASEVGDHWVDIEFNGSKLKAAGHESDTHSLSSSSISMTKTDISTMSSLISVTDIFTLTFSPGFGSNGVWLYLLAVPRTGLSGIHPLDAVFRTAVRTDSAGNAWHGYFNETGALRATAEVSGEASAEASAETSVAQPAEYDGFRYTIEGTGAGTCKLSWNGGLITLSEIFALYNGLTHNGAPATVTTDSEAGWFCIEFDVDSDVKSRYDTQFYYNYVAGYPSTPWTWSQLSGFVRLTFTPSDGSSASSAAPGP